MQVVLDLKKVKQFIVQLMLKKNNVLLKKNVWQMIITMYQKIIFVNNTSHLHNVQISKMLKNYNNILFNQQHPTNVLKTVIQKNTF